MKTDIPRTQAFKDALLAQFNSTTEREKAYAEDRLWQLAEPSERKDHQRGDWLYKTIQLEGAYNYTGRARLLNAPMELWNRIEARTLTYGAAVTIFTKARGIARSEGIDIAKAVEKPLAEYDSLPGIRHVNGRIMRCRGTVAHLQKPNETKKSKSANSDTWMQLRKLIGSLVEKKVKDVSEVDSSRLFNWLEREVKILIEEFGRRAKLIHRTDIQEVEVSRRQIMAACNLLRMNPPRPGQPVHLSLAKRQKKNLVRLYHPDAGNLGTRDNYEAVIKAFIVVEEYAAKFGNADLKKGNEDGKAAASDPPEVP